MKTGHEIQSGFEVAHQMDGIVELLVGSELGLDVLVAQEAHLWWQVLPVSPKKAAIKGNRWEESHRPWASEAL